MVLANGRGGITPLRCQSGDVIVIENVVNPLHLVALGALYSLTLSVIVHRLLRRD